VTNKFFGMKPDVVSFDLVRLGSPTHTRTQGCNGQPQYSSWLLVAPESSLHASESRLGERVADTKPQE
jgi:hypothetical protein